MAESGEQEPAPIPIPDTPAWRLTKAIHGFLDPTFIHRRSPEDARGPWGIFTEDPLLTHFPPVIERHLPHWSPGKYYYDQAEEIAAKQHPLLDIPNPRDARIPEIYGRLPIQVAQVGFARTIDYDTVDTSGSIRFGMQTTVVQYNVYYYPEAPADALFSVGKILVAQEGATGPVIEGQEKLVPDPTGEALQVAQYLEDHMHAHFGYNSGTV